MLIDSDVLIWVTRGHPGAAARLKQIALWRISAVTYMKLAQGCRDKAELERLKKALTGRGTQIESLRIERFDPAGDLSGAFQKRR